MVHMGKENMLLALEIIVHKDEQSEGYYLSGRDTITPLTCPHILTSNKKTFLDRFWVVKYLSPEKS